MKLWVAFFVAAVWVAHLPSQGNAKSLRRLSTMSEVSRLTNKRADYSQIVGREKIITAALITMRKKFIHDDIKEFKQKADDIISSLTPEELASDKLQAIIMTKYNEKAKFTENDQNIFGILIHLFNTPEFPKILETVSKKEYPGVDGDDRQKIISNALFDVIAGMNKSQLMKPNFSEILQRKMNEYFTRKAKVTTE